MSLPCARKDARPFSFSPPSGFCPSLRVQAAVLNFFFFGLFFFDLRSAMPPNQFVSKINTNSDKRPVAITDLAQSPQVEGHPIPYFAAQARRVDNLYLLSTLRFGAQVL